MNCDYDYPLSAESRNRLECEALEQAQADWEGEMQDRADREREYER